MVNMRPVIFFNILIGLIFLGLIVMQFLLQRSLKRSLYNYRNCSYIAGIIFGTVILLSLYDYLMKCLVGSNGMRIYNIFKRFIEVPKDFARFALPVFIVVCSAIVISNISLIIHEGKRLKNILGIFLGLIFVGGTFLNQWIEKSIEKYVLYSGGPFDTQEFWVFHTFSQLFAMLLICYFEVYFIATVIMGYLAAKQEPTLDKDYIIILGCSLRKNGTLTPLLKGRTDRAIKYAWKQEILAKKPVKFVPSGGRGNDECVSEGAAMKQYLLTHGVEEDEIILEDKSKNTAENFLFSRKKIQEIDPSSRICFATTNYHMYRSGLIAKRMGMEIEGVSSRTKWYFWPNGFVREFIAILQMEKLLHIISIVVLAVICIALGLISYYVFNLYGM